MPPEPKVNRQTVIDVAFIIVEEKGISYVNARNIAEGLGCSTKPLFRLYQNMDELKSDLYQRIEEVYNLFITQRWNKTNYLVSQSVAFVQFAREHKYLFQALFLSNRIDGVSLPNITDADWNRDFIESVIVEKSFSRTDAERVFIDMWLYSTGLAVQFSANSIKIPPDEIASMIQNVYDKMTRKGE